MPQPKKPATRAAAKKTGKTRKAPARPSWPDRFLPALRQAGTITGAARLVNVNRATVYKEMKANPDFAADVKAIQDECVEIIEQTLYQCAMNPANTTDRIFYLKTAKPEKYAERLNPAQVQQLKDQARLEYQREIEQQIAELPPEPRRILIAALQKTFPKELTA